MSSEPLYPPLDDLELNVVGLTEEELRKATQDAAHEAAQKAAQEERTAHFKRFIKDKQQQFNEKLDHYAKLKHRWTIIRHVSEGVGTTVAVICAILTIAASTGVLAVPILAVSTASTGLFSPLLTTLTNKTFIASHRKKIKEKYHRTKEILDKLYFSFSKATSDGVITPEEMKQIEKILAQHHPRSSASTPSNKDFLDQTQLLQQLLEAIVQQQRIESRPGSSP